MNNQRDQVFAAIKGMDRAALLSLLDTSASPHLSVAGTSLLRDFVWSGFEQNYLEADEILEAQ